jgi:hypothetical protein
MKKRTIKIGENYWDLETCRKRKAIGREVTKPFFFILVIISILVYYD